MKRNFLFFLFCVGVVLCFLFFYEKPKEVSREVSDRILTHSQTLEGPGSELPEENLSSEQKSARICSSHCADLHRVANRVKVCTESKNPCLGLSDECLGKSALERINYCIAAVDTEMQSCLQEQCRAYLDEPHDK